METSIPMKRVIFHILSVDEDEKDKLNLKDNLLEMGFDMGEVGRNVGYQETLDIIYTRIFPHRTQSVFQKSINLDFERTKVIYDYSKYDIFIMIIDSYSGGHPCRILTGEKNMRLTLGINSDLLWKPLNDEHLYNIPKIFLFNAANFPNSFINPFNVIPPKLYFELPTKYMKNTFVGFVVSDPDKKDKTSVFFETIFETLQKNIHKSFQEIFNIVKKELDGQLHIDSINDCEEIPIYFCKDTCDKT